MIILLSSGGLSVRFASQLLLNVIRLSKKKHRGTNAVLVIHNHEIKILSFTCVLVQFWPLSLCHATPGERVPLFRRCVTKREGPELDYLCSGVFFWPLWKRFESERRRFTLRVSNVNWSVVALIRRTDTTSQVSDIITQVTNTINY